MRHHIIVKWNSLVADKSAMIPEVEAVFAPAMEIDGITKIEVIPNVIDRPNRYDVMIVITMTKDALPVYDASECHKLWKAEYGKYIEAKAIFDAE